MTLPDGLIDPTAQPWLVGRIRIIHKPSREDFTDRIRWIKTSTGEAYVYKTDHDGKTYLEGNIPAYEIIIADWQVWFDGRKVEKGEELTP